ARVARRQLRLAARRAGLHGPRPPGPGLRPPRLPAFGEPSEPHRRRLRAGPAGRGRRPPRGWRAAGLRRGSLLRRRGSPRRGLEAPRSRRVREPVRRARAPGARNRRPRRRPEAARAAARARIAPGLLPGRRSGEAHAPGSRIPRQTARPLPGLRPRLGPARAGDVQTAGLVATARLDLSPLDGDRRPDLLEADLALLRVDADRVAVGEVTLQQPQRKRVLDET